MRYLITGHTGFKGSWLTLLLRQLGHEVSGIALPPENPSLFLMANVGALISADARVDIRDWDAFDAAFSALEPEVVIHLAAQSLVRESYRDPRSTVSTNVTGTMNVLQAASGPGSVQAVLVVTTDKVYQNLGQQEAFREEDPLGGHDPYSASKGMADLLTQSWAASFQGPPIGIARAGNVIGGGDFGRERLLPDVICSLHEGRVPTLRNPNAVRPWQHVLDCLTGYLSAVQFLLGRSLGPSPAPVWNFGPPKESQVPVGRLVDLTTQRWGGESEWSHTPDDTYPEAPYLALNTTRAEEQLRWGNTLALDDAVSWTVDWYRRVYGGEPARAVSERQVRMFVERMRTLSGE